MRSSPSRPYFLRAGAGYPSRSQPSGRSPRVMAGAPRTTTLAVYDIEEAYAVWAFQIVHRTGRRPQELHPHRLPREVVVATHLDRAVAFTEDGTVPFGPHVRVLPCPMSAVSQLRDTGVARSARYSSGAQTPSVGPSVSRSQQKATSVRITSCALLHAGVMWPERTPGVEGRCGGGSRIRGPCRGGGRGR